VREFTVGGPAFEPMRRGSRRARGRRVPGSQAAAERRGATEPAATVNSRDVAHARRRGRRPYERNHLKCRRRRCARVVPIELIGRELKGAEREGAASEPCQLGEECLGVVGQLARGERRSERAGEGAARRRRRSRAPPP